MQRTEADVTTPAATETLRFQKTIDEFSAAPLNSPRTRMSSIAEQRRRNQEQSHVTNTVNAASSILGQLLATALLNQQNGAVGVRIVVKQGQPGHITRIVEARN